jgi:hypothetical protein
MKDIKKYENLIKMVDARKGIPPSLEPLVLKAYTDIFGYDENVKGYADCKCPSYFKLMYSSLKLKLNDYERGISEDK